MPHEESETVFEVEVVQTSNRRGYLLWVIPLVVLAVSVARLREWSSHKVLADGTIQEDTYPSISHYAFGSEPTTRKETTPDGTVQSGGILHGEKEGSWTKLKDGVKTFHHFVNGIEK